MRTILVFLGCLGLATPPVFAKNCSLFVNDRLKQACFAAAADAEKAANAAAIAKEKADKAAQAEDVPTGESAPPPVATAPVVATAPGKCWAFQPGCKTSDVTTPPALRLPGLSINDKLDEPGGTAGKGASFGASTADGQTSIKSSVAVIYKFPDGSVFTGYTAKTYGWNVGIGGQWTKDNSTKAKVDGRTVRLFTEGKVPSVPFLAAARLDGVEDNVTKERTLGLRFNGTFVPGWSQWGVPYDRTASPSYDIYLSGGPHLDRITYAKAPNSAGNAAGLNGRVDADFFPNGILWHFHVFSTFVRARDLYAEGDRPKRTATYYDFGLEWVFLPPDEKGKGLIPALSLHRTIGSNFLDGTARAVTTTLMLTLKAAN